ncbi:MAG: ABC transporter permease subunit [Candidatus Eremiobacteraeota bacterium]|nr:ABC transporter permease subunit [Candidatus Eremiobacteraeota bacterium]
MNVLVRHRLAAAGASIVGVLVLVALFAPLLATYDPNGVNPAHILEAPSKAHWAGTDELGRDLYSRVVWGARPSLAVAFGIVSLAAVGGTILGCLSGLIGGIVDTLVMRVVEVVMALPGLVIALALVAALGPSLLNLTLALGLLGIPFYTRLARGQTLALRERAYVKAARTMGASTPFVVFRHIIPNLLSSVVVVASLGLSGAILAGSGLSFIGLGAQPPLAEWGALVNAGRQYILDQWWYALVPGAAILLAAVAFNLLGDGVRDLIDPRTR